MSALFDAASTARENAYVPYSGYKVGAALEVVGGPVASGCNVENVSFGLTICAERSAVLRMISEGGRSWRRLAVVTKDGGMPCGACLQVLAEFAEPDAEVAVYKGSELARTLRFAELLPYAFRTDLEQI